MFPIYCRVWNFIENSKEASKQVRVTLCRTDGLHHCYRLLLCLNSKFDELKKFHYVHPEKNAPIFCNVWNFYLNVK